jgi:uncharacterized membrane protein YfcA
MESLIFSILVASILFLEVKYFDDLKSTKHLKWIILSMMVAPVGYFFNLLLHISFIQPLSFFIGIFCSSVAFLIYLLKQDSSKTHKVNSRIMIFSTSSLIVHWIIKMGHFPGAYFINAAMLIPLLLGLYATLNKHQTKENKPFNIVMAYLIIDMLTFIMA